MGCSRDIETTLTNTFNEETMRGYMAATPPEQWSKELRRALRDDGWVRPYVAKAPSLIVDCAVNLNRRLDVRRQDFVLVAITMSAEQSGQHLGDQNHA